MSGIVRRRTLLWCAVVLCCVALMPEPDSGTVASAAANGVRLPFDATHPVVYVNDNPDDAYTDEYLEALAAAGSIRLRGIITHSPVAPYNTALNRTQMDGLAAARLANQAAARASGWSGFPDAVSSRPWSNLVRPPSGRISDTAPLNTPGGRLIVDEARAASGSKPLVVVVGGPLTAVADAYLLDPTIAYRIIVSYIGGRPMDLNDYNSWADPWAAYICVTQLRMVLFPVTSKAPVVTKHDILRRLPDTPIRTRMYLRDLLSYNTPDDSHDYDAPAAIALMRPDYVKSMTPVSFTGFMRAGGHDYIPTYAYDPDSRVHFVTSMDGSIGTAEWWRALSNPVIWRR